MLCKFDLIIDGVTYELSNSDIKNWKEISYSLDRIDYGATARTFTSKFEFINQAYDLLFAEYRKNYLTSYAIIEVYTLTNNFEYEKRFSCPLDFASIKKENMVLSLNAKDDSIAALIKSKKGTQYEYNVDQLKEENTLFYDRLEMKSLYSFTPYQLDNEKENQDEYDFDETKEFPAQMRQSLSFPLLYTSNEITPDAALIVETKDIYNIFPDKENVYADDYLFKNISNEKTIAITVSYDFSFRSLNDKQVGVNLVVWRQNTEGRNETVDYASLYPPVSSGIVKGTRKLNVPPGCFFVCEFQKYSPWDEMKVRISSFLDFSISLSTVGKPVNVYVIKPVTLLNCLLKSMNADQEGIKGIIDEGVDERLDKTLLVPAESIRGLDDSKIYSSYSKFAEWIEYVYGFIPVIDEDQKTITFTHRNKLFSDVVSKNVVNIDRNASFSLDSSLIYSRVKVGYDKQDYSSINGRDEFHFTNEYTTGITLSDKSYEMISPYRSDPYGVEFLAQSRGKKTTDNDSDNDVFFVCAELVDNQYKLLRTGYTVTGTINVDRMFNSMFSARFMIDANAQFIGAFTSLLKFASSDGNSNVIINGISEGGDIILNKSLFTIGVLDVTTDDETLPSMINGMIRVEYDNDVYYGYIKSASCKYGQYDGMKYKLMVKTIE